VLNGLIAEQRSGVQPELVTTSSRSAADESGAVAKLEEAGVEYRLFRRISRSDSAAAWGLSPSLTSWLARNISNYDVLHMQYVWCWTTIAGCALARFHRVPVVLTPHESLTNYDIEVASRSRLKRRLKKALRRLVLRWVDSLVLMSALEERDTDSRSVPVFRVPHAVLPANHRESNGRIDHSKRSDGEALIGFIGRQTPKKGVDRLIRAIALSGRPGWTLNLAGPLPEPELEAKYRDLTIDLNLEGQVKWLGFVDDRDAYMASLDVLVMPSEYEGFGMVAAEAMASGTAVIVPPQSGIAEVVEAQGGGIVLEKPEAEVIAAALEALLGDPRRGQEIGRDAMDAIAKTHSPEKYAAAAREVYERTLEAGADST